MDYLDEDDPEEVSTLQQDSDAYSESEDDGTKTVQESNRCRDMGGHGECHDLEWPGLPEVSGPVLGTERCHHGGRVKFSREDTN